MNLPVLLALFLSHGGPPLILSLQRISKCKTGTYHTEEHFLPLAVAFGAGYLDKETPAVQVLLHLHLSKLFHHSLDLNDAIAIYSLNIK